MQDKPNNILQKILKMRRPLIFCRQPIKIAAWAHVNPDQLNTINYEEMNHFLTFWITKQTPLQYQTLANRRQLNNKLFHHDQIHDHSFLEANFGKITAEMLKL